MGNFFFLVLAIIISLIIGEVFLRVYFHFNGYVVGVDDIERFEKIFYLDSVQKGGVINISSTLYFEYDPIYGYHLRPNFVTDTPMLLENDSRKLLIHELNINKDGFRALKDYDLVKSPDILRILAIGDSYTFGSGLHDRFSYPALTEFLIDNSEVLNFGVEGYGIDQAYLTYLNKGKKYDPDILIFGIFLADIQRAGQYVGPWLKPRLIFEEGHIILDNAHVISPEEVFDKHKNDGFESYLFEQVKYFLWSFNLQSRQVEYGFGVLDGVLDDLKISFGDKLIVMIISTQEPTANDGLIKDRLISVLNEKNINFRDGEEMYEWGSRDTYYNSDNGHFSVYGNALIAWLIKDELVNLSIIPASPDFDIKFVYSEKRNNFTFSLLFLNESKDIVDELVPFDVID